MITWREYLDLLRKDGVSVAESEDEALSDDGERVISRFLVRVVDGEVLTSPAEFASLSSAVPRMEQRRIANRLRLPPEKYIFKTY